MNSLKALELAEIISTLNLTDMNRNVPTDLALAQLKSINDIDYCPPQRTTLGSVLCRSKNSSKYSMYVRCEHCIFNCFNASSRFGDCLMSRCTKLGGSKHITFRKFKEAMELVIKNGNM